MKQIKTVIDTNASFFDKEVNTALKEGWKLVRRYTDSDVFIAELEREEIAEAERECENCKYVNLSCGSEPCLSCRDASKWEAEE